ncbi:MULTISPECIES: trypsin-like peptidase domain-containing protein [unclassified Adlercreutzia]|uniref:trypsin-like peptidase domain-containing protein n=1 Tax=unclassified Adlercreutzia TaxID=2636013 RepID=UPI0013EBF986|nr:MULTISPECIES: trypsin-like peptidase domain-containing protein [unclassified Adlercreutzia]
MKEMKSVGMRLLSFFVTACLAMLMAAGIAALPATQAHADEEAVRSAASGVMKFNWSIDGAEYSRGSCFLINDDTVITGYHCTFFSQNELDLFGYSGQDIQDLKSRMTYSVTINRDVTVGATLVNASEAQDFAIFKLDQVVNNHKPLTFRNSMEVKAAEPVYTIGFPANSDLKVINTYTTDDVTIKNGTVSKVEGIYQGMTSDLFTINGYYLQTNCPMSGGDSGGPMVDANGYAVGVSLMSDSSFYYAAASDKIMEVLDDLGVEYNKHGIDPDPEPVYNLPFSSLNSAIAAAEALDASKYTEESYKAVTAALAPAKEALNLELEDNTSESEYNDKKAQIDDATKALNDAVAALEEAPEGLPLPAIIGIIVAIVAVIAIIVVVVVMSRKKKGAKKDEPKDNAPATAPATFHPVNPLPDSQTESTTVLAPDGSETIILFQAASGGSLTRMSTNEHIPINSAEFTIGRERSQVSYCLEGNSSISRIHVRFLVEDGKTYLVDQKAANGTYVNGVKVRPGQKILLKSGDVVTLADEKFKYSA